MRKTAVLGDGMIFSRKEMHCAEHLTGICADSQNLQARGVLFRARAAKFISAALFVLTLAVIYTAFALHPAYALEDADSRLTIKQLQNGLTVVVWEDHANPIVTVDVWMKVGSLVEDDQTWGIAHYFEHMFYRGTDKRGPRQNRDEIIDVGGMTSAGTWYDYTHFYNIVASEHFDLALDTLTDSLQNLTLLEKNIFTERSVITEEIKQRLDDPSIYPGEEMLALLFPRHRYGKRVIGTLSSISNFSRQGLLEYYARYYAPQNTTVVISGDVKPAEAIELVQRKVAGWKNTGGKPKWNPPENGFSGYSTAEDSGKFASAQACIGFRMPGFRHPDRYALEVAEHLLISGRNATLKKLVNIDVSGIHGSYDHFRDAGTFVIYASPMNDDGLSKTAGSVISAIAEYAKTGPSNGDVSNAISELLHAIRFYQSGTSERARLLGEAVTYGNPDYYLNYADNILKVTPDDVRRVINAYFVKDNLSIIFMRPQPGVASGGKDALDNALAELPPSEDVDFDSVLYRDNVAERSGTGAPPAPELSESRALTLNDGMKAIIVDQPGADICSMGIFFPAGCANDPKGKEGLTQLTLSLLEYGSAVLPRESVWRTIAELGNQYGYGADRDYSQVFLTTTVDMATRGLEFLKDIVRRPTFDSGFFEEARANQFGRISGAAEDIVTVGLESFKQAAFNGHPYSQPVFGTPESLQAITPRDVGAHWERMSNPDGAVLIFVGDAGKTGISSDPERAIGRILFGTGTPFESAGEEAVTSGLTGSFQVNLPRQQNFLVIGARTSGVLYNGADDVSGEYGPLMVLGSLLSIRSFREIVYEKGLAYRSVGSFLPWRSGGVMMFYLGYSPDQESAVFAAVSDQIAGVCSTPPQDEELRGVKGFITGYQAISLESAQDKLLRYGQWEMTGAGFDFYSEFINRINEVTPEQVQAAAQNCFSEGNMLQIVVKG